MHQFTTQGSISIIVDAEDEAHAERAIRKVRTALESMPILGATVAIRLPEKHQAPGRLSIMELQNVPTRRL